MSLAFSAYKYLPWLIQAKGKHGIHSPFVFDLLCNVLSDKGNYYAYDLIESVRAGLLLSDEKIDVVDFGTGNNGQRAVSEIARKSVSPKKYGQLLFRMVNRFQPKTILEMGTSLGISTLYLSMPLSSGRIISLEGSPGIAHLAEHNFKRLRRTNIELMVGEFDDTLPVALEKLGQLDMAWFDGNHRGDATIRYFESCIPFAHEGSVLMFDDIHWSADMHAAWDKIRMHERVTLSIDLYRMGMLFFSEQRVRQHFQLRW